MEVAKKQEEPTVAEKKLKILEDYFSIIHDSDRPARHQLAIRAIAKIVKDAETIELKCIKAICDEALYQ